ncbi:beta-lactamase family protein [Bacillaceae bacterium SIJ1]|uniref:serine hydrolase domain-containing protein n=1 Tax=Litoribacterium kuwaitense TaxID=1398745 RepID=UPI0013ED133C|nr:serine hydrolase [Litoribacterium kuwaitense]NGP45744.1 beta-lactamase family protein [Litoribacterium kuwaitense]
MGKHHTRRFEQIFTRFTRKKNIYEGSLLIENKTGDFSFYQSYSGLTVDSPLLMASITKLFTTTCILRLLEQGKISLDEKIAAYFDKQLLEGLHMYRGQDYSFDLTIYDLLFQTSGLPDIYEERKNSMKSRVIQEDFHLSFEEIIEKTKHLKPHFAPNSKGKAYYADVNFDLLGEIIKKASDQTLSDAYKQFIVSPLDLVATYLIEGENDKMPHIYYKDQQLHRPMFIQNSASGGSVTTTAELMVFIKAFFGSKLFNKTIFTTLATYRKLQIMMGPIHYGGGYMQIPLGGASTLFQGEGELIGHSGSTGSLAFYHPQKDLYFVGNVNQMASAVPIRLAMQLAMAAK